MTSWPKTYYQLTKPERTLANVLTAAAGFLFASKLNVNWQLFLTLIAGTSLVIASSCVLNNYIDRRLDQKMARTKKRALASGQASGHSALTFAAILGIAGFWILSYTNWLTFGIIAIAYFSYVVVYGIAKRHTVHSTLIGTIPGAASLVAGYTAVTNRLDDAALILFLIMLSWQMVHFYAIAIYRLNDYRAAKLPVMPAKKGVEVTKLYMWFYLVLFVISTAFLTFAGYTGYIYLSAVLLLGFAWARMAFRGFKTTNNELWAKEMFRFSLIVLLAMSGLISVGSVLP